MCKILIAENIPSLNKGELVILGGMIESFKELGEDVTVSILSAIPDFDKKRYGGDINVIDVSKSLFFPRNPLTCSLLQGFIASLGFTIQHIIFIISYFFLKNEILHIFKGPLWKEYLDSDAVIIGHNGTFGIGGGLLPDIKFFSYFSYIYLPFFGKILKRPIIIYGGSVGKFTKKNKILALWMSYLLNNINLITLREETAYSNLISMGINNMRSFVTADLAFLLKPSPKIRINEIIKEEGLDQLSRPLIGVTVYRKIAQKAPNGYLDHIRIMANTIDRVIEDENSNVIFLPHSIGFSDKEDDRIVAKEIFEACKNKDHIKIIFTEYNPEELKGLLGYVDFLIGERLHSVINALSMCTPSIMLSYRGDIRLDIIRMIGQESAICYIDHLDPEDLLFKIKTMMSIRNKITEELKIQIPVIRERSRGNALKLKEILNPAKHS